MENISANADKPLSLEEAVKLIPARKGRRVAIMTVKRWLTRGYRGIRLKGVKTGGTWTTTAKAIAEFQTACAAAVSMPEPQLQPSPNARLASSIARQHLRERHGFYRKKKPAKYSAPDRDSLDLN